MSKFSDLKRAIKENNLEMKIFDRSYNFSSMCQLWEIKKDKTKLFKGYYRIAELYFTFGIK